MRWPFMTKARHDELVKLYKDAVDREYARALADGKKRVHAFMRDAAVNLMRAEGTGQYVAKVRAVFVYAEKEFKPSPPTPRTLSDVLYAPANVEEAIDRAAATS